MTQPLTHETPFEKDNRVYERIQLRVSGQLFDPASEQTVPCEVLSLSPGGAGLSCKGRFAKGANLILYIEGFGRFEGNAVLHGSVPDTNEATLGLSFVLNPVKKKRVAAMLALFVREGLQGISDLRQARRVRTNGSVEVVLGDGQCLLCEMIDISLDGVSLKTMARPPIGEIAAIGQTKGQVARHHDSGFAIQFIRDLPS